MRGLVVTVLALALAGWIAEGCSKSPTTAPPPPPAVGTVTVTPPQAVVLVQGTLDLTANMSGTKDSTVTWRLLREPGVNDTVHVGTIVATGAHTARFTAPSGVDTPGFDLTITLQAVDVADTSTRGSATVDVPRVQLNVVPGSVRSVPPGTQVPLTVSVQNATNNSFSLSVRGIPGGDQGVGTWVQTGATSTIYTAPSHDTLDTYILFAQSAQDPHAVGTAQLGVRAGFAVPTTDLTRSEYAPEWNPIAARVAFVRGGPPWDLVVYDFVTQTEQVLTTFTWSGPGYDGRIAWSTDGSQIAFSQQPGAHRVIGLIQADGSGLSTFAPDGSTDYEEASFFTVSSPAVESLYVAQSNASGAQLRAYPMAAAAGDPGRLLLQGAPGAAIRSPDAIQLPTVTRPSVAFVMTTVGASSVLNLTDNGNGVVSVAASGAGARSQARWVIPSDGVPWVTYVDGTTQNMYRAQLGGLTIQRVYTDFFPESGGDLKAFPPINFHFYDAHVVARLQPDGHTRLWVIGFPPSSLVPVSRPLETELRRAGLWQAISPAGWSKLRGLGWQAARR